MTNNKVRLPTMERIKEFDAYRSVFNAEVGGSLKWIMRMQGLSLADLEARISGVSSATWRSYSQMSYTNNRPLHVIASFSWLTQVSMVAIFKGNHIQKYWPGVSDETIQSIVCSGLLPEEQFEYLVRIILSKVEKQGYLVRQEVMDLLNKVPLFNDDFLMPEQLNIEEFKEDYYRSVAQQLILFRERYDISIEHMSDILGEPVSRIQAFEDLDNPVSIPMFAAVRLKLGFELQDTALFTAGMKKFHAFYLSREVQQAREQVIITLLKPLSRKDRKPIANLIQIMLES